MTKIDRPPGGVESVASPTFTGTVTAAAISATGDVVCGDAAGDAFKTHGTAGSGAQSAMVAAAAAGGTGDTAGAYDTAQHRDDMITLVNAMRTCLINHGLMAAS
jgi:hypothetical protein